MIDLDIKGFFDNLDWELVLKAVRHHVQDPVGPAVHRAVAEGAGAKAGR